MKYLTRNGGATVTVMVPFPCSNSCPFCINKAEYADASKFNLLEVERSIKLMSVMNPECDFVFTGGEPLANIDLLATLIDAVHQKGTKHKVFINTTLPTNANQTIVDVASKLNIWHEQKLITGVNISRHLRKYVQECDDEIFKLLKFEVRINCVIPEYEFTIDANKTSERIKMFVDRFRNITKYIQFRADYVNTTPENLYVKYDEKNPKESSDMIFAALAEIFAFKGVFGAYRMRVGYEFDADGYKVTYHRTLPYSRIYLKNDLYILYDIIIKQNGDIKEDWDTCVETKNIENRKCDNLALDLDLNAYRLVTYEEYK